MCGPKGYEFSAVCVINRVLTLVIFVMNSLWFLHSYLDMDMFFNRSHFFTISCLTFSYGWWYYVMTSFKKVPI